MKIYNILKKLDEQKRYYESRGMMVEAATVEETKTHLTKYINTQVVSKKEVSQAWDGGGANISDFIEKIITLLSQVAALPKEEIEQTYNVQSLKTIYYLIHNSNLEMNRIIDGMKDSSIGELAKYGKSGKRSTNDLLQNMDLYSELKSILLYEHGEWVKEFAEFYENGNKVELSTLTGVPNGQHENILELFQKTTGLSPELIQRLATVVGSQTPNRGRFETLFALLCKGGKFKINAKGAYTAEKNEMSDTASGDIIIDKKGIELKVNAGTGSGRIGGQKGYNSVEAIKKAYMSSMKMVSNAIFNTFASKVAEKDAAEFEALVGPYRQGNIELSLDLTKTSKVPHIDTVIQHLSQAIILAVGPTNGDIEIQKGLTVKKALVDFYKSIWCNSTIDDKTNKLIANLIDNLTAGRGIDTFASEGVVISADNYYGFTQEACAKLFSYYADCEPFDYIFIINADKNMQAAKMLVLSHDEVKNLGKADAATIAAKGLAFNELGQMYGAPARKVRPSIDINF